MHWYAKIMWATWAIEVIYFTRKLIEHINVLGYMLLWHGLYKTYSLAILNNPNDADAQKRLGTLIFHNYLIRLDFTCHLKISIPEVSRQVTVRRCKACSVV